MKGREMAVRAKGEGGANAAPAKAGAVKSRETFQTDTTVTAVPINACYALVRHGRVCHPH